MKRIKLLAVFAVLALVFAACTTGGEEEPGTTEAPGTTEPSDTTAAPGTTGATDTTAPDTGGEGDAGGAILQAVLDRGTLNCGVNDVLPAFGIIDDAGEFSGFDIDFCRAVAAGVLGDPEAVEFVPLVADARFTAL